MGLPSGPIVIDANNPTLPVLSHSGKRRGISAGGVGARCDLQIPVGGVVVADDGVAVDADRDRRGRHGAVGVDGGYCWGITAGGVGACCDFQVTTVLAWLMMGLPSGPIVIDECCPAEPESTVVIVAVSVQVGLVHAATFKAL